jgi:hypothetical protein
MEYHMPHSAVKVRVFRFVRSGAHRQGRLGNYI